MSEINPNALVPAQAVTILWEDADIAVGGISGAMHGVHDVVVLDSRDPSYKHQMERHRSLSCSDGCVGIDWMTDPRATPEAVFGGMLSVGFKSQLEMLRALVQFAEIQGCEWARSMVRGVASQRGIGSDADYDNGYRCGRLTTGRNSDRVPHCVVCDQEHLESQD